MSFNSDSDCPFGEVPNEERPPNEKRFCGSDGGTFDKDETPFAVEEGLSVPDANHRHSSSSTPHSNVTRDAPSSVRDHSGTTVGRGRQSNCFHDIPASGESEIVYPFGQREMSSSSSGPAVGQPSAAAGPVRSEEAGKDELVNGVDFSPKHLLGRGCSLITSDVPNQQQVLKEMVKPHIQSFNFIVYDGLQKEHKKGGLDFAVQNIGPQREVDQNGRTVMVMEIDKAMIHCDALDENNKSVLVFPAECREQRTTYEGRLSVSFKWKKIGGKTGSSHTRNAGNVPIMVKSLLCNLSWKSDQRTKHLKQPNDEEAEEEAEKEAGGYFIINGQEKVIPMIIRPRRNFPMAIVKQAWTENQNCTEYGIELHCARQDQTASTITLHYLTDGGCDLAFLSDQGRCALPVLLVLRALVNFPNEKIFQSVMANRTDTEMRDFMERLRTPRLPEWLSTQEKALKLIGKNFRVIADELPASTSDENVALHILKELVYIHLSNNTEKFHLLVFMIRKLFALRFGNCASDSPDSLKNQEVELGGQTYLKVLKETLEIYLRDLFTELEPHIRQNLDLSEGDIDDAIGRAMSRVPDIDNQMVFEDLGAIAGQVLPQATGITESDRIYQRLSIFRSVYCTCHYPLTSETSGLLCPVANPPAEDAPTINHLAAFCTITTKQPNTSYMTEVLNQNWIKPNGCQSVSILLDGKVVGTISPDQVAAMVTQLQEQKSEDLSWVPPNLEIGYVPFVEGGQYPGLYLFTTPAQLVRPVYNSKTKYTELIGSFEQACIAASNVMEERTTHRELCKGDMFSAITSVSPFGQNTRSLYQRLCHFCEKCNSITSPPAVASADTAAVLQPQMICQCCQRKGTLDLTTIQEVYWQLIGLDMNIRLAYVKRPWLPAFAD